MAGKKATPERIEAIRQGLGLDQPIYRQYGKFVKRLAHGDLGESYYSGREVRTMIGGGVGLHRPAGHRRGADRTARYPAGGLLGPAPAHVLGHRPDHHGTDHLGYPRLRPRRLHAVRVRPQAQSAADPGCRRERPRLHPCFGTEPGDAHHARHLPGAHRGRLHLVHAARFDARGDPFRLHSHGTRQGSQ